MAAEQLESVMPHDILAYSQYIADRIFLEEQVNLSPDVVSDAKDELIQLLCDLDYENPLAAETYANQVRMERMTERESKFPPRKRSFQQDNTYNGALGGHDF